MFTLNSEATSIFSKFICLSFFSAALCAFAPLMHADLIYTLNQDGCTGTCGTAPFGTVSLAQGTNSVNVTVTLAADENFAGTGAGDALEFNVAGSPSIGSITSGFSVGPAPDTASTFGSFLESVTCDTCKGAKGPVGPLTFTVSMPGITVNDFTANSKGYVFASDILGNNGKTGNVAAAAAVTTPEPMTFSLLGAGLLGIGLFKRRLAR
jgi:hypothetical protein